jgi:hypothetical protein
MWIEALAITAGVLVILWLVLIAVLFITRPEQSTLAYTQCATGAEVSRNRLATRSALWARWLICASSERGSPAARRVSARGVGGFDRRVGLDDAMFAIRSGCVHGTTVDGRTRARFDSLVANPRGRGYVAAIPMIGARGGLFARLPTKALLEKSNTPPSLATMR